jgi:DNA helicase IV
LLENEKIKPENITLLSPFHRETSVVSKLSLKIGNYNPQSTGMITFSTIRTFKGLENVVIILTDIESYQEKQLMYVALSRARSMLIVFESKNARIERDNK